MHTNERFLPAQPIREIHSLPFENALFEPIQHLMQAHGGRVEKTPEHHIFSFPEGTTKREKLPRVRSERSIITFPDGFVLYEIVTWHEGKLVHVVSIPITAFPQEIQRQYASLAQPNPTSWDRDEA